MVDTLTQQQLVNALADMGKGYAALLLGAGASRSSGVLLAREIVYDIASTAYCRHFEIAEEFRDHVTARDVRGWLELQEWYQEAKAKGESDYSAVFRHFKPTHDHQIEYIRCLLRNAKASSAYRALAHLIHEGVFELLLTTNFEQLAENCYRGLFEADARIRSISSEGEFLKATIDRNTRQVCYLHGNLDGYRLANLDEHTRFLRPEIKEAMTRLLNPYALVVIGYSGSDHSVMSLLNDLAATDPSCFRRGVVYWCRPRGTTLSARAQDLLGKTGQGFEVEIHGFDRLILDLCKTLRFGFSEFEEAAPKVFASAREIASEPAVLNVSALQRLPDRAFCYRTGLKRTSELAQYRDEHSWWQATVREGRLWLIGDPDEIPSGLADCCSASPDGVPLNDDVLRDTEMWNIFSELANKALDHVLRQDHALRIWKGRYFFTKPKGKDERPIWYQSRHRKAKRRVVWPAFERGTEEDKTRYFCHEALAVRVRRFRDGPVLRVTPTRLFTVEGDDVWDSRRAGTSIGRSTSKVWNLAYDSLVRMWLSILSHGTGTIGVRFSADGRKPEYRLSFSGKPIVAKRVQE